MKQPPRGSVFVLAGLLGLAVFCWITKDDLVRERGFDWSRTMIGAGSISDAVPILVHRDGPTDVFTIPDGGMPRDKEGCIYRDGWHSDDERECTALTTANSELFNTITAAIPERPPVYCPTHGKLAPEDSFEFWVDSKLKYGLCMKCLHALVPVYEHVEWLRRTTTASTAITQLKDESRTILTVPDSATEGCYLLVLIQFRNGDTCYAGLKEGPCKAPYDPPLCTQEHWVRWRDENKTPTKAGR